MVFLVSILQPKIRQTCLYHACCIFRPELGCCALQTLVKICFLNIFHTKMLKKHKNWGFRFAPKRWSKVLFQEKHVFIGENMFLIQKGLNKKLFSTKTWKSIFWPAFGVHSTQTLVEICNTCLIFFFKQNKVLTKTYFL